MERGTVRFLAVAKAADGPLECRDRNRLRRSTAPPLEGSMRRETGAGVRCERSMRMDRTCPEDGGGGRGSRKFTGHSRPRKGVVASRAPRRVRRTLDEGACEAARPGNWSRRFLLWMPSRSDGAVPPSSRAGMRSATGLLDCRTTDPSNAQALPSFRWQALTWPGATSLIAGRSTLQRAKACGQRGWKAQPGGGSSGEGSSPAIGL